MLQKIMLFLCSNIGSITSPNSIGNVPVSYTHLDVYKRQTQHLREIYPDAEINPLGDWTGGTDVYTGATNRKLGSDMADSVTGGGLHGKDLSLSLIHIS